MSEQSVLSGKSLKLNNIVLLILVSFLIFIVPLFSATTGKILNNSLFTLIFFIAVLALEKYRRKMLVLAIVATVTEWLASFLGMKVLDEISSLSNFIFFSVAVFAMIAQVARSKTVSLREIIESINGYLLLGLIYSLILVIIYRNVPGSLSFPIEPNSFGDFTYYGFVTMTTLGYGDITPVAPIAKSAAVLISVTGQLYVATIIAILIGKYSSNDKRNKSLV